MASRKTFGTPQKFLIGTSVQGKLTASHNNIGHVSHEVDVPEMCLIRLVVPR